MARGSNASEAEDSSAHGSYGLASFQNGDDDATVDGAAKKKKNRRALRRNKVKKLEDMLHYEDADG